MALRYDLAGIGSRGAAALLDTLIQGTVWVLFSVAFAIGAASLRERFPNSVSSDQALVLTLLPYVLVTFVLLWGYFPVFETTWNGQTPGKRILGLRVIRENGYPVRAGDVLVRSLIRVVEALPPTYWIGLLVMLLNGRSKRLGDMAAGTVVVREGARRQGLTFGLDAEAAPGPTSGVAGLRADDATLVRDFLDRRTSLEPRRRAELAARLATAVELRYGVAAGESPGETAEIFLERVLGA